MPAHVWSRIGLVLDILGVLLLSVEAIKLENLRRLRARLLIPLHEWSKPAPVTWAKPGDERAVSGNWDFAWWLITHGGSGALTLYALARVVVARFPDLAIAGHTVWLRSYLLAKIFVVAVGVMIGPLAVIYVGEGWHYLVIWITGRFIAAADFVDRRTPDGTIGIIGVSLAVLGFLFQLVGTWPA